MRRGVRRGKGTLIPRFLGSFLFSSDGSSLTGWTNSSVTVNDSIGRPAPSFAVGGSTQYATINPGSIASLFNKTITFDVRIGTIFNFFLCNHTGVGHMLRLETRTGGTDKCGFASTSSFTSWSAPQSGIVLNSNTWYSIKIRINSSGSASYFVDGTAQQSGYTISNFNRIAIHGDGAGGTSYVDNIVVYDGLL